MRPGIRHVSLTVLLALVAGSACDPVTAKRATQQFVPIKKGTRVDVRTGNGWIKVVQGRPGIVDLTTHRRASALVGKKGLGRMKVTVTKEKGGLQIRGTHPDDPKQRRYQLNFVVKVPPGTPVTLRTGRGDLRVFGAVCDVDGETRKGEIRAKNVRGTMKLVTRAGNIHLVGHVPRFDLESHLGNVKVSLVPGNGSLKGASKAVARSGDVTLTLGAECGASITAEARAGGVASDWPTESKQPKRLRAQVGVGSTPISLLTHKGRVRIHKAIAKPRKH